MTDQAEVGSARVGRTERGQDSRGVIKNALEGAGEKLTFTELREKCQSNIAKKSKFAYHLKILVDRGEIVYDESSRKYGLALEEANSADVRFWLAKIKESDGEAKMVAVEEFKEICRNRIIPKNILQDYVIPLIDVSIKKPAHATIRARLLAALQFILKNSGRITINAVKEKLSPSIQELCVDSNADLETRNLASSIIIILASSTRDFDGLIDTLKKIIGEPEDNVYNAIAPNVVGRLEIAEPDIRKVVRDWLFDCLVEKDARVRARAKQLIRKFREEKPPSSMILET